MADKGKISFDNIQNQISNLTNTDTEFDDLKVKELDIEGHTVKKEKVSKTIKEQVISSFTGVASIALLGILAQILFPWWTIVIVGFWVGYWIAETPTLSFAYGFLSMSLIWSIYAAYQSLTNGGLMVNTVSGIMGGQLSGTQIIYATGTLGGFVTGLGTSTGALLRQFFEKKA